jgi:phage gp36-like protein
MPYVTPTDMRSLYDPDLLVQGTNYNDPAAETINDVSLSAACQHGSAIVDGYLLTVGVAPSKFSDRFLGILKIHSARIALNHLLGVDDRISEQAQESIEWLKSLSELSQADLANLITGGEVEAIVLPLVRFEEGRRWNISCY